MPHQQEWKFYFSKIDIFLVSYRQTDEIERKELSLYTEHRRNLKSHIVVHKLGIYNFLLGMQLTRFANIF